MIIATWFGYCLLVSALLGAAAFAAERALNVHRRPVRWTWLTALVSSVGLPAIAYLAPSLSLRSPVELPLSLPSPGVLATGGAAGAAETAGAAGVSGMAVAFDLALGVLWVLSVVAFGAYVAVAAWRVRGESEAWVGGRLEDLPVMVARDRGPAVVGLFRSVIVLPEWAAELEQELLRMVFLHEEEHRRAGDNRLFAVGLLCLAATPWNPVLWWQLRRLRLAIEYDCDRRVLSRGVPTDRYGEALLQVGSQLSRVPIASPAFAEPPSNLERRVRRLTSDGRGAKGLRVASAAALAAVLAAVSCEAPSPTAQVELSDVTATSATTADAAERGETKGLTATAAGSEMERPKFIPYDVPPQLQNGSEVMEALERSYPAELKEAGVGGRVELWMYVDESGSVENSQIKTSSGVPELDEAARGVIATMRFQPALNRDQPTPVWVSQWITFGMAAQEAAQLPLVVVDGEVLEELLEAQDQQEVQELVNELDIDHIEIYRGGEIPVAYRDYDVSGAVIEITTKSGDGAARLRQLLRDKRE